MNFLQTSKKYIYIYINITILIIVIILMTFFSLKYFNIKSVIIITLLIIIKERNNY